jgi:hypothetical protein
METKIKNMGFGKYLVTYKGKSYCTADGSMYDKYMLAKGAFDSDEREELAAEIDEWAAELAKSETF